MKYLQSMPFWLKFATYFLLASIATFSFKKPTFFFSNTNIDDLLLFLSFICFSIGLYRNEFHIYITKKVIIGCSIACVSIFIGTLLTIPHFGPIVSNTWREYIRILVDLIMVFEIYTIGYREPAFIRDAILALTLSSIILLFIFLPPPFLYFFLDDSRTRFTGLLYDPNYYATLQILPAFIFLWLSVERPYKKIWITLVSLVLFALSASTILWSGSRGGILGFLCGIFFLVSFMIFKKSSAKKVFSFLGILLIGFSLVFVLMPSIERQNILSRAGSILVSDDTTNPLMKISGRQGRQVIWANALTQIKKNPLGYGPNYGEIVDIQGGYGDHHRVAHNTLLQIFLTGGCILFLCISYGFIFITKKVLALKTPFGEMHYLYTALIAILAAGFFLDSLWSRWVWIIIGIILVLINSHLQEKPRDILS